MVYLCRSEVLLIFKHDQSHVMINGDAHIFKGDNSSLTIWILHRRGLSGPRTVRPQGRTVRPLKMVLNTILVQPNKIYSYLIVNRKGSLVHLKLFGDEGIGEDLWGGISLNNKGMPPMDPLQLHVHQTSPYGWVLISRTLITLFLCNINDFKYHNMKIMCIIMNEFQILALFVQRAIRIIRPLFKLEKLIYI